jgi:peptide deformylase
MKLLKILEFPDPRLRTKAKPVQEVTNVHKELIDNMIHTMYESKGIGLAATQVDFHERILVIDISEERDNPQVFINPEVEILNKEEKSGYEEGCLSVPGFYEEIIRPEKIKVTYLDRDGKKQTLMPEGLLAVVIQHEIDHLPGIPMTGKVVCAAIFPDKCAAKPAIPTKTLVPSMMVVSINSLRASGVLWALSTLITELIS